MVHIAYLFYAGLQVESDFAVFDESGSGSGSDDGDVVVDIGVGTGTRSASPPANVVAEEKAGGQTVGRYGINNNVGNNNNSNASVGNGNYNSINYNGRTSYSNGSRPPRLIVGGS